MFHHVHDTGISISHVSLLIDQLQHTNNDIRNEWITTLVPKIIIINYTTKIITLNFVGKMKHFAPSPKFATYTRR